MEPLRRRATEVKKAAAELFLKATSGKSTVQKKYFAEARELLLSFADELAKVRILDPACGSGNFLYVSLKLLLDLEREMRLFAVENGLTGWLSERVTPAQVYGIELDTYAHELASVVVWIGYLQWLHDSGSPTPSRPILKSLHNIERRDALLAYDLEGNATEAEWPETEFIIGNPPFVGDKKMRRELGDKYVEDVRRVYDRIPGQSDFVCYWFEKARTAIEAGKTQRAGLLATQGIRGGANRTVLDRIKVSGDIFWAESDRDWVLEGATVHVSMVGFDDGTEEVKILDGKPVSHINPNLTTGVDVTKARRLAENARLSFIGTQKGGPFDIDNATAKTMLDEKGNPNNRPNSDVVRPWLNGEDLTDRIRGMWIIDFGTDMPREKAAEYVAPFEYVKKWVYPLRKDLRRKNHREYWWLHAEARPGMRKALKGLSKYIVTPRVSKHRIFVWCDPVVVPDSAVVAIARSDDYFVGVLQSRFHEVWARSTGTQLREAESGFRYTPQTCFDTFPFPYPPGTENDHPDTIGPISQLAAELDSKRQQWLNPKGASFAELKDRTLTNLYNEWPTWLADLHTKLDAAVAAAYGWNSTITDEEIKQKLLDLNIQRPSLAVEDTETDEEPEILEDEVPSVVASNNEH
jgi:type II restriction/modification system DNA methylase subunit YeeA